MLRKKIVEYSKGPALFIIGSPFQALCAIEAIKYFSIKDYTVIVSYFYNENRQDQTYAILKLFDVDYTTLFLNKRTSLTFALKCLIDKKKYSIAFVGDFYRVIASLFSVLSLKRNGLLLYLDDGNSSIEIFKDELNPQKNKKSIKLIRNIVKKIILVKRIKDDVFFSLFSDIPNAKFQVIENTFENIGNIFKGEQTENASLFIGAVINGFCEDNHIENCDFYRIQTALLKELKKEWGNVIYIPHGRDKDDHIKVICEELNVEYRVLDVCIELYLLQNKINPVTVCGFASSALFTIKRLFPASIVYNVQILSSIPNPEYVEIDSYYQKHGIKSIVYNV